MRYLVLAVVWCLSSAALAAPVEDVPVEFHPGDRVPLALHVGGDLVKSVRDGQVAVVAQRNFFLEWHQGQLLMSYDGMSFQPAYQLVTGQLSAGIEGDPTAYTGKIDLEVSAK